ncbi:MAG TPA: S9 family peptidase [Nocardioidaceae bacterium]|nr:S9 family peptidase [Nocardioidaceae bacterium]
MSEPSSLPEPPVAKRVPVPRTHHGDTFVDDYEWLRDKQSPDTIAYLKAENAYYEAATAHLGPLRSQIFDEIKARTQETDLSVPTRSRDHWYYRRTREGSQYPVLCRCPVTTPDDWTPPDIRPDQSAPDEEVMLDCNELAEGHDFFSLGTFSVSVDGSLLAYSIDVVGDERYTIRIKNLGSGELLPDEIPNTVHRAVWAPAGDHLFYTTVDAAWRPDKVWRHAVGTAVAEDAVVHHERDEKFWTRIWRTTSDRFLVVESGSKITSEVRLLAADDPTGVPHILVPREEGVEYSVEHSVVGGEDRLLVLHNRGALNFALGAGTLDLNSLDELEPVIPASDSVRLTDVQAAADCVVVNLREAGLPQVRVFDLRAGRLGAGANIDFDEPMFDAYATGFSDWRQPLVRLSYGSWLTPDTVLEYDPRSGERYVRKQTPVLGGYDPAEFVQTREWVTARDGAQVPLSIVRHKDVQPRANTPLLLYGYGSYEASMDPAMRIPVLSLLERGMVWACAHIRGGGEMGRAWYEHGKKLEKKNTFNDFVDCARHLVDTGWTSPDRLVAQGGSAGGLLMGAVANAAPELFAGIEAIVPFVDALTSILDPALPLTVIEWDEWGDPLHDREVYAYMRSYTPYENVAATAYPAIYARTSINDTRVLYVEPAKWVARLRATATGDRPIVLVCEMSAGHGGASGRYDKWRQTADVAAWAIHTAGASSEPVHRIGR